MEWLKDLIAHLAISRALVVAIFITALTMVFGPRLAPQWVPAPPSELAPYAFPTMVLTGCLLIIWIGQAIWFSITRGARSARTTFVAANLTENEAGLLFIMGQNPTAPFNLDRIDYERIKFSRLELLDLTRVLAHKGLVRINESDENIVSLTEAGQDRALAIQRQAKSQHQA